MQLEERTYGYELSELEKTLLFRRENTGFVRYAHDSGRVFYLDPSPFLKTSKREVFVAESTPPPPEKELVEVFVKEEKDKIVHLSSGLVKIKVKIIESWRKIDPKSLVSGRGLITREDFVEFFKTPYTGEKELVDGIGISSALFVVSSPPVAAEKGGVNTAVFGKRKAWHGYNRVMSVIPNEFRKINSPYFYSIKLKEERLNPPNSVEVNLSFCNPKKVPMHIPIPLEVDVRNVKPFEDVLPLVRAYMLQALLLTPEIPDWCHRIMRECAYELIDDVKRSGFLPCKLDLGSLVPRIASSIARLNANAKVKKDYFKECLELWSNLYYRAIKLTSTPLKVSEIYRLSDDARKLYVELVEMGAVDNYVPEKLVLENTSVSKWSYDLALEELRNNGLVIVIRRDGENLLMVLKT